MVDIHKTIQSMIEEFRSLEAKPPHKLIQESAIPRLIATGDGGSIIVNDAIDKNIGDIAHWMYEQSPHAKSTCTRKEWRPIVRSAVGRAILKNDSNCSLEESGKDLKRRIEEKCDDFVAGYKDQDYSMGCSLFSHPLDASFTIGPVVFEPKLEWLNRALSINHVSKITYRRIAREFSGRSNKSRKLSMESLQEKSILDVLRNAQMVCTVMTNGLAPEVAQKRSIIAARLAQTSIALMWRLPSKILSSFQISVDPGMRTIQTIPFTPGTRTIGGWEVVNMTCVHNMSNTDWNQLTYEEKDIFDLAGNMISCWTSATEYDQASSLLRSLSQSLSFFEAGCREENDLMSIVKFTAALESLVPGEKEKGVLELAKSRLNLTDDQKIYRGKTIRQTVKLIYRIGRSRTLHGTNVNILHDWSDTRAVAEILARNCILYSMDYLIQNPSASHPENVLK